MLSFPVTVDCASSKATQKAEGNQEWRVAGLEEAWHQGRPPEPEVYSTPTQCTLTKHSPVIIAPALHQH